MVLFVALLLAITQAMEWAGVTFDAALNWWTVPPPLVAALGASWILTVRFEKRPLSTLGLPGGARVGFDLGFGALAGAGLMGTVLLIFLASAWLSWAPVAEPGSPLLAALDLTGLLLLAAFAEELLFRGYPFQVLLRRFGPVTAILGTAVGFGALHGANEGIGPLALANITLAGVWLGACYLRTGSLWFATGVHFGWNLIMAVSDLPVSGIPIRMPGFDPVLSGPVQWTGGAFGPEGGLTVTFVTIAGTILMWRFGGRHGTLSDPRTGAERTRES